MTIFNSQPINTDPNPYQLVNLSGSVIGRVNKPTEALLLEDRYRPRTEYDNNVNPVLYAFRFSAMNSEMSAASIADSWLWLLALGDKFFGEHAEDVKHATKVLRRLSFLGTLKTQQQKERTMTDKEMQGIEIARRVATSLEVTLEYLDNAVRELQVAEDAITKEDHDATLKQQEISDLVSAIHVLRGPVALRASQWTGYHIARLRDNA